MWGALNFERYCKKDIENHLRGENSMGMTYLTYFRDPKGGNGPEISLGIWKVIGQK